MSQGQCWLCQHALQQGVCVCVCVWVCECVTECFESSQKTWKSLDRVCSSCTRCVCSQGLSFSSSFLLLNHVRSELLWGLALSQVMANWFLSQGLFDYALPSHSCTFFLIIFSCCDKAADKTLQTNTTDLGFSILWSHKGTYMRENTVMRYFVRQGSTTPNITRYGLILPPHFVCNWAKLPPDTSWNKWHKHPSCDFSSFIWRNRKEIFDGQRSWTLCRSVTEPVGSLLPVDPPKAKITRPPAHPTTLTLQIKHRFTHLDAFWRPILIFEWKSWYGLWNIE